MSEDKLVMELKDVTNGFVTEGVASLEIGNGVYETHLKRAHVGHHGGINVFNAKELSMKVYRWATVEDVVDMMALDEFPLNLRTFYRTGGDLFILEDTPIIREGKLSEEDLRAIIANDFKEIEREFECTQKQVI